MFMICQHVQRLELQVFLNFVLRIWKIRDVAKFKKFKTFEKMLKWVGGSRAILDRK